MTGATVVIALVLWAPALRAQLAGNLAWDASMLRLAAALLLTRLAVVGLVRLAEALASQRPPRPRRRREDLAASDG